MRFAISQRNKISSAIAVVVVLASAVVMSLGVRAATGRHIADLSRTAGYAGKSSAAALKRRHVAVPLVPATAPSNCQKVGDGFCGKIEFKCDPVSATDTILVSSGTIGIKVTDVRPDISFIFGTYLKTGKASVAVCASHSGLTACGDPIDVTFGNTVCGGGGGGGGGGSHSCPKGEDFCQGECAPLGSPQCDRKR